MNRNLKKLVKEYKGEKLEDGKEIGRKGILTNARLKLCKIFIDALFVTKKEMSPVCPQKYGSIGSLQ